MSESITNLTNDLIASYAKVGGINHLDGGNLPSKFAIATITSDLLRLLLPGFFDEKPIQTAELKVEIAMLMDSVSGRLEDEITKSIEYKPPGGKTADRPRQLARELTLKFLGTFPAIRELLKTDVEAAYAGDPAAISHEEVVVAYPFIETIAVQRMAHELYKQDVTLIPRIMSEWAHSRTGIDLHPGAKIGSHFFIDHGTGTVVGQTTVIGNNVKIYHGVTLGAKSTSRVEELRGSKRHPHHRRRRNNLPRRHNPRRQNSHRGEQHHRRQRLPHTQRPRKTPSSSPRTSASRSPTKPPKQKSN